MIGDDLGGQGGPLFDPAIYRDLVKPRYERLVWHIRGGTNANIWYHTCGSCLAVIPDLYVRPPKAGSGGFGAQNIHFTGGTLSGGLSCLRKILAGCDIMA